MRGRSWRLGRIAGIEIDVDPSFIIIAVLIALSFFAEFQAGYPSLTLVGVGAVALFAAAVFFGSVLLHELAHSFVSEHRGIPVKRITLFMFGGATEAHVDAKQAVDELLITVVGPLTSLLLGAALFALAHLLPVGSGNAVVGAIGYLGYLNLALGVFNLVPGFPLDGGRILRATAWQITGNYDKATVIATTVGRFVAYAMIALGGVLILMGQVVSGIWLGLIGWFLATSARASVGDLHLRRSLAGMSVRDVMTPAPVTIPVDTGCAMARHYFFRYDQPAFPIVDHYGTTVGILGPDGINAWQSASMAPGAPQVAGECMRPLTRNDVVEATNPAASLLDRLQEGGGQAERGFALVSDNGQIVGFVTRDILSRGLTTGRAANPGYAGHRY
ncbi:MAG: site-2 protease family protein [Acidimicrobiales bacterium]